MTSKSKTYPGISGHTITRSEFEDGILRDNARQGNRLNNEMKGVEKAKRVIVRSYDKESQILKQKMASAALRRNTHYTSQTSVPNGSSSSASTTKTTTGSRAGTGRSSRLIPDYEYKQHLQKQNGVHDPEKQTTVVPESGEMTDDAPPFVQESEVVDGKMYVKTDSDDLPDDYVSTRRTRPPKAYWNNLSAPKHQNSVREVRERLAQEFSKPKSQTTTSRSRASAGMPTVQGARLNRK